MMAMFRRGGNSARWGAAAAGSRPLDLRVATILLMRIDWRDEQRRKIGRVEVDAAERPTRAPIYEPGLHDPQREAFLQWEGALDDAGQLRKCLACGCSDLWKEKAFPQVTGFVIIMAFVGAIVGALGLATNLPVLLLLIAVLVLDVAILVFSTRRLVCYRCRTRYHEMRIARYHQTWDRSIADRYPASAAAAPAAGQPRFPSVAPAGGVGELAPATATSPADDSLLHRENYFS
jgi:hypothetical protein